MQTPKKQPVAADLDYVDVDYIQPGAMNTPTSWSCAVKREGSFAYTVGLILAEGIYAEDNSWFIPASAIVKIRDRRGKV
jgi:hypothetical protein